MLKHEYIYVVLLLDMFKSLKNINIREVGLFYMDLNNRNGVNGQKS